MTSPSPGAVIDVSVVVSFLVPEDAHHALSRGWLRQQLLNATPLVVPILLLTEVGGAIARRTQARELGHRAVAQLQRLSALRIVAVDHRLGFLATELAVDLRLRGADAVYVALAVQLDLPLVSWDREQRERASARANVMMPS